MSQHLSVRCVWVFSCSLEWRNEGGRRTTLCGRTTTRIGGIALISSIDLETRRFDTPHASLVAVAIDVASTRSPTVPKAAGLSTYVSQTGDRLVA